MSYHVISIDQPSYLSVDNFRLQIDLHDTEQSHFIPFADIALIILNHPRITLSKVAMEQLTAAGGAILITDGKHLPIGLCLPLAINQMGAKRPHQQARFINQAESKELWQRIVQVKIQNQAELLKSFGLEGHVRLEFMVREVEPGDPTHIEAQAAKLYWKYIFALVNSTDLTIRKRHKQGADDIFNICLNYGYAIVRAMIARALAGAGLCLNFGHGHVRLDNPMNLVEDWMEPFRHLVDRTLIEIILGEENSYATDQPLNKIMKQKILGKILATEIDIEDKQWRLLEGIDRTLVQYCQWLDNPNFKKLSLPKAVFFKKETDNEK